MRSDKPLLIRRQGLGSERSNQLGCDLERFITGNWFWRGGAEQSEDEFAFFTSQRSRRAGLGYRFLGSELGRLDVWGSSIACSGVAGVYSLTEVQLPDIKQID